MLGKFLKASAAVVLGSATAMTAQANYYAQPMMQQPMMAQPMMAQPMMAQPMMAQPMMAPQPAPVISPTIVVNNANNNTQQQSNQNAGNQGSTGGSGNLQVGVVAPLPIDLALQRCALGGMLMGRTNPGMASLTNVTTPQSSLSATTSGMSSPETCVKPIYVAAAFIRDSMSELEADLTMGRGEHLVALNSIMACNTASKNLRVEYASYTQTAAYSLSSNTDKANQLFQIVDRNLSSSACSA